MSGALGAFAAEVGNPEAGPVTCVGGRTQWSIGGLPDSAAREVRAPGGILEYQPAEMVVRCGAGTVVSDLKDALAAHGQTVALPDPGAGATVGGVLAVGRSDITRLGHGPVRDTVLEVRYVSSAGIVVKGGGPVVKNVSGYDLCRLMVGSLGTLGLLGEVVLRCRPLPPESCWLVGECDPFELRPRLYRPGAILWDGSKTWVLLEGHPRDVEAMRRVAGSTLQPVEGPPPLPRGGRLSLRPSELRGLVGEFVAEIGVGVVHVAGSVAPRERTPEVAAIERRLKRAFDPTGRLNPGRVVP